jgi:hypothetical protein
MPKQIGRCLFHMSPSQEAERPRRGLGRGKRRDRNGPRGDYATLKPSARFVCCSGSCKLECITTPAERIEKAFNDAQLVIADYLQPGPRDPDETLRQLISVIDNREVYDAVIVLLIAEKPERSFVPY